MKERNFLNPTLPFILFAIVLFSSCIKNDNFIVGDSKVRIFNTIVSDTSQNFFFNKALFNSVSGISALASSTNSAYFVIEADKEYEIDARNSITGVSNSSIKNVFSLGKNYSIYYTQTNNLSTTKPKMIIYEDLVRQDTSKAQIMLINLGHTLKSKVNIASKDSLYSTSLGYGEKTDYISIKTLKPASTLFFNLVDSTGVRDSISYTNFIKGKVYTIIIEGAKNGKLKERLVPNN